MKASIVMHKLTIWNSNTDGQREQHNSNGNQLEVQRRNVHYIRHVLVYALPLQHSSEGNQLEVQRRNIDLQSYSLGYRSVQSSSC